MIDLDEPHSYAEKGRRARLFEGVCWKCRLPREAEIHQSTAREEAA